MVQYMIQKIWVSLLFTLIALPSALLQGVGFEAQKNEQTLSIKDSIIIDNRVLATVRGQVITVLDLVKKMDMIFYRQYPEYRSSPEARIQFYKTHWRSALKEAVDRELVIAYAEQKKFQVSRADVRQELEELFGPDVMLNLYETGLQIYDVEAMIESDILMRQILLYAVKMPILGSITPDDLYQEYQKRYKSNSGVQDQDEEWQWRSFTFVRRSDKGAYLSSDCIKKLKSIVETSSINSTESYILSDVDIEIIPSPLFTSLKSTLSQQIIDEMGSLPLKTISNPISIQGKSVKEGSSSWKSYMLIAKKPLIAERPDFRDQEAMLREEIASRLIEEKTLRFFSDLQQEFGVHYIFSDNEMESFDPFQLNRNR